MRTRLRLLLPIALAAALPVTGCSSTASDAAPRPTTITKTTVPGSQQFDLYVAEETVPCTGVAPQECLQVRRDPNAEWELHYGGITGFDFEPGFSYHLVVEQRPWVDPPADAPSFTWHLVRVLSKQPAQ
ncbi:DUF4377 domain-containing protein [Nocardia jejuensis]|uniref:DUF4377 domain-containing protein n=1 Tax=Nocardia jejuensis TaxID=328049 RepID=UPI0008346F6A|nr:DUF4377 domain-containing protein [Nocardia jejuensis]